MFRGFPSCKKNPRKLSVVDVRTGSYLAAKSAYVPWLMMSRQDRSGIPRGQILMIDGIRLKVVDRWSYGILFKVVDRK